MPRTQATEDLREAYVRTLADYLRDPSEESLAEAYRLGRRALSEEMGIIEWATVHDEAVSVVDIAAQGKEALPLVAAFFRESLSPFEMTQRGYAETNRWLERLNQELRREVAAKERLAEQLQDANQELEAFSYSVAHDLRAPLRAIAGFSAVLSDKHAGGLGGEATRLLERIQAGVRRMSELIDGLLALSRVGRGELVMQEVDLAARARAILATLNEAEPQRKVLVDIAEPMRARGDARLLSAVLENLLGNAWKFTSKKATAHIRFGVDLSQTPPVYFVSDDGAGFDQAHASKLFGVFQRLHSQEAFPGTGVGLATVQRIVRRHGGRIWAQSAIDKGTTFFFTLSDRVEASSP